MKYPHSPGFKENTTSKAAAKKMESVNESLENQCLAILMIHSLTADEVAARLRLSVLSIRPRVSQLYTKGKIQRTGARRMNESGNRAHVYKAVKEEKAEQQDWIKKAA
jgi:predicted transcriptional regulator